jgi:hypothetical protein
LKELRVERSSMASGISYSDNASKRDAKLPR